MSIFGVCILCIGIISLGMIVKQKEQSLGLVLSIALTVLILSLTLTRLEKVQQLFNRITEMEGDGTIYLQLLLKMTGIAYVAQLTSDICKEAGYITVSKQIMIMGRVSILVAGYPIVEAFIQLISQLLE